MANFDHYYTRVFQSIINITVSQKYLILLIRSPIRLLTGRSSPRPPGAFTISLQSADFAQPGIPENGNS